MSRRKRCSYDSEYRRQRYGFDRESSPKRSRRDGKQETERVRSTNESNTEYRKDRDQKHQHSLGDALPLEKAPSVPDSKLESGVVSKDSDKNPNGHVEANKGLSDPTDTPRSRSFFQHDERGNRSFGRRATTDRRQRDLKDDHFDSRQRDERVWRHDGFIKMEAEPAPPARKRPAFREKKELVEPANAAKEAPEPVKPSYSDRRGEKDHNTHHSNRYGKPVATERKEPQRGGIMTRESHGGGGRQWGREGDSGRRGYIPGGNRAEKWKHDLFDEANKSPIKKNEEDQIAKVEALLSS